MDTAALATAALRAERQATHERHIRQRTHSNMEGASLTRTVRCSHCGGHEALFRHVNTTRDIGKSETWGTKESAGLTTMLRCCACGTEWTVDNGLFEAVDDDAPAASSQSAADGTRHAQGKRKRAEGSEGAV